MAGVGVGLSHLAFTPLGQRGKLEGHESARRPARAHPGLPSAGGGSESVMPIRPAPPGVLGAFYGGFVEAS